MMANGSAGVATSLERESAVSARRTTALRLVHSNDSPQADRFENGSPRRPYSEFWRGGLRRFSIEQDMFAPFRVY